MCEGWPQHRGLRPLVFSNSGVGSFTSHKNQICVSAVRLNLRFFKAALSTQLFKDPECWSGRGSNPWPPAQQTGALPTELTRRWDLSQQVYTCTTLVKNEKFDNCSALSQKSEKLFSEMFFICYCSNKGDSKGIQHTAIKSIVPHAFGDHSNCETRVVSLRVTQQRTRTKSCHMEKICKEKKLELALINIFNGRDSTDAVAEKLALSSVIGSKNKRQILWWKWKKPKKS